MADMSGTITAKSDQLNAGDLLAGPVNLRIKSVDVRGGDQPVSIHTESNFQPYKPCLSMRRVLAKLWGGETDNWIGKSLVLYNDPTVVWAGKEEGGIRISHMEGIKKIESITVRKNKRSTITYNIEPLKVAQPNTEPKSKPPTIATLKKLMDNAESLDQMVAYGELIKEHKESFSMEEEADLRSHYTARRDAIKPAK